MGKHCGKACCELANNGKLDQYIKEFYGTNLFCCYFRKCVSINHLRLEPLVLGIICNCREAFSPSTGLQIESMSHHENQKAFEI